MVLLLPPKTSAPTLSPPSSLSFPPSSSSFFSASSSSSSPPLPSSSPTTSSSSASASAPSSLASSSSFSSSPTSSTTRTSSSSANPSSSCLSSSSSSSAFFPPPVEVSFRFSTYPRSDLPRLLQRLALRRWEELSVQRERLWLEFSSLLLGGIHRREARSVSQRPPSPAQHRVHRPSSPRLRLPCFSAFNRLAGEFSGPPSLEQKKETPPPRLSRAEEAEKEFSEELADDSSSKIRSLRRKISLVEEAREEARKELERRDEEVALIAEERARQEKDIAQILGENLSEPYTIETIRYLLRGWPHLTFLAYDGDTCAGVCVCKIDKRRRRRRRGRRTQRPRDLLLTSGVRTPPSSSSSGGKHDSSSSSGDYAYSPDTFLGPNRSSPPPYNPVILYPERASPESSFLYEKDSSISPDGGVYGQHSGCAAIEDEEEEDESTDEEEEEEEEWAGGFPISREIFQERRFAKAEEETARTSERGKACGLCGLCLREENEVGDGSILQLAKRRIRRRRGSGVELEERCACCGEGLEIDAPQHREGTEESTELIDVREEKKQGECGHLKQEKDCEDSRGRSGRAKAGESRGGQAGLWTADGDSDCGALEARTKIRERKEEKEKELEEEEEDTRRERKVVWKGYVAMLAVRPAYRRRGLGRYLVRRALHEMKKGYHSSSASSFSVSSSSSSSSLSSASPSHSSRPACPLKPYPDGRSPKKEREVSQSERPPLFCGSTAALQERVGERGEAEEERGVAVGGVVLDGPAVGFEGETDVAAEEEEKFYGEVESCRIETEATNAAALRLYDSLGFRRVRHMRRFYLNGSDAFKLRLNFLPRRRKEKSSLRSSSKEEGEEEAEELERRRRRTGEEHEEKRETEDTRNASAKHAGTRRPNIASALTA